MAIFLSKIKFQCSGCGECCKRIGNLSKEYKKRLDFPYDHKTDGSCEKLGEDNKCMVYDSRPSICSVEKTFDKYHKPKGRKRVDVYMEENKLCNQMIKQSRLDEKYLIDLQEYLKYK
jgi:Fe-S-cluster containining protein